MPLTEEQTREIKERLYRYAIERDRPGLDWELLGAKIALDAISVIAELRASQAREWQLLTDLEALEWQPQRNVAGGTTAFCPVCHGCVGAATLNEKVQPGRHSFRMDGHKKSCDLALILDRLRAALAATAPAPTREGA